MYPAVSGNKGEYIVKRMRICFRSTFEIKGDLIRSAEHFSDIGFAECCIYIGKLMVDCLHKSPNRLIHTSVNFFSLRLYNISIDINNRLFQALRQIKLCIIVPVPHLYPFCFLDRLILGQL